jgi:hypothetical protein
MTGNQILPPATIIKGGGPASFGFVAKNGTTGYLFCDYGTGSGASKIGIEDCAFYGNLTNCPNLVSLLKLGVSPAHPHGTGGYVKNCWFMQCAGSWTSAPAYSNTTAYVPGNIVTVSSVQYVCITAVTGTTPPNTQWQTVVGYFIDINGNVGFYSDLSANGTGQANQSPIRIVGAANICSRLVPLGAGPNCYSLYLNGEGTQIAGLHVEAPGAGSNAVYLGANTEINGANFSLADGISINSCFQFSTSCTTWRVSGFTTAFGSAGTAVVQGGNFLASNGTYFGSNATGAAGLYAAYNSATAYTPGNLVSYTGTNYVCIANTTGNLPTNATYWTANPPGTHSGDANYESAPNVWGTTYLNGAVYATGAFSIAGKLTTTLGLGLNGVAAPTQVTGFGAPTGGTVVNNFPGATATLVQTSETVAEILAVLQAAGLIGA